MFAPHHATHLAQLVDQHGQRAFNDPADPYGAAPDDLAATSPQSASRRPLPAIRSAIPPDATAKSQRRHPLVDGTARQLGKIIAGPPSINMTKLVAPPQPFSPPQPATIRSITGSWSAP